MSKISKKLSSYKLAFNSITVVLLWLLMVGTVFAVEQIIYYHSDALGSVVATTDENGDVLWRESYRPFGSRIDNTVSTKDNTPFYTGKPHDDETGLSYFGARYYDPFIGRFIGIDPEGVDPENLHSFNRYAYANNNPYRYVDPNGKWAEDIVLGVPSITLGMVSIWDNIRDGNFGNAAVDALGIVADGLAVALPGIPGGAGLGIKAAREAGEVATKKSVVIGENMKNRVIPHAEANGGRRRMKDGLKI